jgi:hypothetical protein
MNMITIRIVRAAALAAAVSSLSLSGFAGGAASQPNDPADQILKTSGSVPISRAGSDIRVGSPKSDVSAEIGHANRILPDGSWLIQGIHYVDHSNAHGILLVSFSGDRVSAIRLVTRQEAVALALHRESVEQLILLASSR